ncbi:2Fe-2S iron-sulfur cluster-binding protein [Thermodesulfobacteriota bacterium]
MAHIKERKHIRVTIMRQEGGEHLNDQEAEEAYSFDYVLIPGEQPTALDVLLRAKEEALPDLAFRYGCRNRRCGLCTIDINGKPALACREQVRDGDRLGPLKGLPLIRDLVVDRHGINALFWEKPRDHISQNPWNPLTPGTVFQRLSGCIECYACLEGCPLQEKNLRENRHQSTIPGLIEDSIYPYGNPFRFLHLRRTMEDNESGPEVHHKALSIAINLGLESCRTCLGCKCQMGISLVKYVIKPLLENSGVFILDRTKGSSEE